MQLQTFSSSSQYLEYDLKKEERDYAHSKLLHGLDPVDDWLTELLHPLFFRIHSTRFPAISWLEVPVCNCSLTFVLWFPDDFHGHAKFCIPRVDTSQFIGNCCIASVNNDICMHEGESLQGRFSGPPCDLECLTDMTRYL